MRKAYAWIGLKNDTKGFSLTWLLILLDANLDYERNITEGNSFDENPWLVRFRDTAPENVRNWAANKPMEGTQSDYDAQELYIFAGDVMPIVGAEDVVKGVKKVAPDLSRPRGNLVLARKNI